MNEKINYKQVSEIMFGTDKKWNIHRLIIYSLLIMVLCYIGSFSTPESKPKSAFKTELLKYDSLIPKGYSLIPLDLANSESLDSLLGNQAVVDLYARENGDSGKTKLIAKRVRIIRSPKNPNVFAALCKREMTPKIYKYPGPFYISLLNPDSSGTEFVNTKNKRSIDLDYFSEI